RWQSEALPCRGSLAPNGRVSTNDGQDLDPDQRNQAMQVKEDVETHEGATTAGPQQRQGMPFRREGIRGCNMQLASTRAPTKPTEPELPHVIIVGGGVAGLILATRLGHVLGRRRLAR